MQNFPVGLGCFLFEVKDTKTQQRYHMRQGSFEVTKGQGPYRQLEKLLADGAESIPTNHEVTVNEVQSRSRGYESGRILLERQELDHNHLAESKSILQPPPQQLQIQQKRQPPPPPSQPHPTPLTSQPPPSSQPPPTTNAITTTTTITTTTITTTTTNTTPSTTNTTTNTTTPATTTMTTTTISKSSVFKQTNWNNPFNSSLFFNAKSLTSPKLSTNWTDTVCW